MIDSSSPPKHSWSLVVRGQDGSQVWRDNLTGYFWSDRIGWGTSGTTQSSFNWCRASGANNQAGSPYAEDDPKDICDNPQYQSSSAPESACAEDPTYLSGTTTSAPAKGGLGKLSGATTPLTWWLPSMEQARTAYTHGAHKVLPRNFANVSALTRTMDSYERTNAWYFTTHNMVDSRMRSAPVFCIGAP